MVSTKLTMRIFKTGLSLLLVFFSTYGLTINAFGEERVIDNINVEVLQDDETASAEGVVMEIVQSDAGQ